MDEVQRILDRMNATVETSTNKILADLDRLEFHLAIGIGSMVAITMLAMGVVFYRSYMDRLSHEKD